MAETGIGDSPSAETEDVWKVVLAFVMLHLRPILIGAAVGMLLATVYAHFAPRIYSVTLTVTPTATNTNSSLRSLGTLSSMFGISNPLTNRTDPFDYYVSGFTSYVAAERLARDQTLMHRLFYLEWSDETHSWHPHETPVHFVLHNVAALVGVPVRSWSPPDAMRLQEFIKKNVSVDSDKKTRITTISMRSDDPQLASRLLIELHNAIDGYLRDRTMKRATQYINYINSELQKVTVAEYRQALIDTASEQEKLRMAASSNLPFVAEPFGGPEVSAKPVFPNVPLLWALGAILGMLVGALLGHLVHLGLLPPWHRLAGSLVVRNRGELRRAEYREPN